jgi:hypothetical protein
VRNFPKELNEKLHELCESLDIPNEYEVIHKIDLELMIEAWNKLDALEAYGVDNWEGYGEAMQSLYNDEENY